MYTYTNISLDTGIQIQILAWIQVNRYKYQLGYRYTDTNISLDTGIQIQLLEITTWLLNYIQLTVYINIFLEKSIGEVEDNVSFSPTFKYTGRPQNSIYYANILS